MKYRDPYQQYLSKTYRRETPKYPSVDTNQPPPPAKAIPQYTGDRLLGIAIMHKSCLQPVFSEEQARESAQMRR